jgi:hypothetical protein
MAFSHVFGGTWGNPWPHSHGRISPSKIWIKS